MNAAVLYLGALAALVLTVYGIVSILGGSRRWKDNYEAERERRERAEERVDENHRKLSTARAEILTLTQELGELKARPDFDHMLDLLARQESSAMERTAQAIEAVLSRFDERFQTSERRAEERHHKLLGLFETLGHSLSDLATEISERNSA